LEVTAGGRPVPVIGRRQRELLAVLLLRANQMVSVDLLIDLVGGTGRRPPRFSRL
jgi:DNA-binding SARP family transcriptional activator